MSLLILHSTGQGQITKIGYVKMGGKFSVVETLKLRGVGSDKVIYQGGIDHFDLLNREIESEVNFVNFEIARKGLILFSNCNQRHLNVGILYSNIRSIKLLKYINQLNSTLRANLRILTSDGHQIDFEIPSRSINSIELYFHKSLFNDIFHVAVQKERIDRERF